jgi:hypothetical protein
MKKIKQARNHGYLSEEGSASLSCDQAFSDQYVLKINVLTHYSKA